MFPETTNVFLGLNVLVVSCMASQACNATYATAHRTAVTAMQKHSATQAVFAGVLIRRLDNQCFNLLNVIM